MNGKLKIDDEATTQQLQNVQNVKWWRTGVGRSDRPAMKLTFEVRKNVIQLFTQSFLETTVLYIGCRTSVEIM
jgi:hypothetical protein